MDPFIIICFLLYYLCVKLDLTYVTLKLPFIFLIRDLVTCMRSFCLHVAILSP